MYGTLCVDPISTAEAIKMQCRAYSVTVGALKMTEETEIVEVREKQSRDDSPGQETNLIPVDQYLKAGIHIGTKFKTNYMKNFIFKARPDGLHVLNLKEIDNRISMAANLLSQYEPDEIVIVCKRENGWKPVKLFSKLTGIRSFPGRYPPGILTNTQLKNFMETKIILAVDSWPDRNAIKDALRIGVPVIALCDTNNQSNDIDLVVPCNNKGKKALGLLFYLLAREYMAKKGLGEMKETVDDFTEI